MQYITIVVLTIFSLISGAIGYTIKDSTPPVIVYRDTECATTTLTVDSEPSIELKELSISLHNAETKLKNCWYSYSNDCNMDCVIPACETCTDFSFERQEHLELEDGLMKKVDDCKEAERLLREEYEDYKAKYNNLF